MFASDGFLLVHIAVSLIAIAAGFVVVGGFLARTNLAWAAHLFLAASVATNVTGLLFPFAAFLPSHAVAIVALLTLAPALYAYYAAGLAGAWRRVFAGTAVAALYFNVFVLIAQTFAKNPGLAALAPTQSEPPFLIAQLLALATFVALGRLAVGRARSDAA